MIEIINLTKKRILRKPFKKIYNKIFDPTFELSVVFAPPFLMLHLNKKFLNKNKAADVLSFLLEKNKGEIFINASSKNLPYLFAHGSLHLLRYNHNTGKNAKKMEEKELNILKMPK